MDNDFDSSDSSSDGEEREDKIAKDQKVIPVPEYTEDELGQLLLLIQQIATCYDLAEEEISESFTKYTYKWLYNVTEPVLFVYFDQGRLSASLGCPLSPVTLTTYFIREKHGHMFTVKGFYDEVSFGTFHENVDETFLHLMNTMFLPALLKDKRWNDEVKTKLFNELHMFAAHLTDISYKIGDTLVLYVPKEGHDLEAKEAAKEKKLVKRYENVLNYWTSQIRSYLKEMDDLHSELMNPADEQKFWVFKFQSLTGTLSQIQSKNVEHILDVLRAFQSCFISNFDGLIKELMQEVQTSASCSKFLTLLLKPFEEISTTKYPKDIPAKLPNLICQIRVLSVNCDFFKNYIMTQRLFIYLSHAIISFCKSQVDVTKILNGEPRHGIKICDMSIDCCMMYKLIYQHLAKRFQRENFQQSWALLEEDKFFSKVDVFVQRLKDMIEICEAIIVFSRKDETVKVPPLVFGGHNGNLYTKICVDMEKTFDGVLSDIKAVSGMILDVNSRDWYTHMRRFQIILVSLDGLVTNIISQVFSNITDNVEEALDALTTLYNFSMRKTLQMLYEEKLEKMWKMFETEVVTNSKYITENNEYNDCLPPFAGKAVALRIKLKKSERLKNLLVNAQYLPKLQSTDSILQRYDEMMKNGVKKFEDCNKQWIAVIDKKPESLLKTLMKALMSREKELLECNIHRDILKIFNETRHFDLLDFPLPELLLTVHPKAPTVSSLYNQVVNIVLLQNRIFESLSVQEKILLKRQIKKMERIIQPGILRVNYSNVMTSEFIADCMKQIVELQHFIYVRDLYLAKLTYQGLLLFISIINDNFSPVEASIGFRNFVRMIDGEMKNISYQEIPSAVSTIIQHFEEKCST